MNRTAFIVVALFTSFSALADITVSESNITQSESVITQSKEKIRQYEKQLAMLNSGKQLSNIKEECANDERPAKCRYQKSRPVRSKWLEINGKIQTE